MVTRPDVRRSYTNENGTPSYCECARPRYFEAFDYGDVGGCGFHHADNPAEGCNWIDAEPDRQPDTRHPSVAADYLRSAIYADVDAGRYPMPETLADLLTVIPRFGAVWRWHPTDHREVARLVDMRLAGRRPFNPHEVKNRSPFAGILEES